MSALVPSRFRSAMLEARTGFLGWLGRRLFDHIEPDPEAAARLRALAEQGHIVYVMRTRSLLDYLFFNSLFLKFALPLARFANGVNMMAFRGAGEWLRDVWGRILGRTPPDPAPQDQLERAVRAGDAALLFMKVRQLTAERESNGGFIERLVALQRRIDKPILLVPQVIVWPRKPPSTRRTWFDILFGEQEASGRLRKLGHFIRHRRSASVQLGEPVDLQKVIAEHEGWSDVRVARLVRRVVYIHLAHEAMAVRGPSVKPGRDIRREVLEGARFRRALKSEAASIGVPFSQAMDQSKAYLREISASMVFEVVLGFSRFLDFLFNRIYEGVEVDLEGMRRVKEAAKLSRRAPLILLPSHKSHIDYLVISWVFLRNEFIPPHIAAGANLSFFPVGSLFRHSGAFFLRRSFKGMPLYSLVFKHYLWKLVREGYPVEFYPEGGRSRTGKLLPPKLGMLSMLMEGVRQGEFKDLQFVPINISYERVLETGAYKRELQGGEKKSEGVTDVVKAGKVLAHRYGRVYVSFEEPVRLTDWLQRFQVGDPMQIGEAAWRAAIKRLGYDLMRRIQEATVVTPSALVSTVLLSDDRRGMSSARLRELAGYLVEVLTHRGARMSKSVEHNLVARADHLAQASAQGWREGARARGEVLRPLLDEALYLLQKGKLLERVDRGGESLYTVPEKARLELDYYRNAVLGILAPDAFVATALRATDHPLTREQLAKDVRRLSYWFRLEFVYKAGTTFDENLTETLDRLIAEGLVSVGADGRYVAQAPRTLDFLRGTLLHLVEGYWVAADALRGLAQGPMEVKRWLAHAREHGEREFLEGDVRRAEAMSSAVLRNALELFREEGLVVFERRSAGKKSVEFCALAGDTRLEAVAARRDDLGLFLVTHREDPIPRPADDPAPTPAPEAAVDPPATAPPGAPAASSAVAVPAPGPAAATPAATPAPAAAAPPSTPPAPAVPAPESAPPAPGAEIAAHLDDEQDRAGDRDA